MEMAGGFKGGEYESEEKWTRYAGFMPVSSGSQCGYGINFHRDPGQQIYISQRM